jgi:hypothetical protein
MLLLQDYFAVNSGCLIYSWRGRLKLSYNDICHIQLQDFRWTCSFACGFSVFFAGQSMSSNMILALSNMRKKISDSLGLPIENIKGCNEDEVRSVQMSYDRPLSEEHIAFLHFFGKFRPLFSNVDLAVYPDVLEVQKCYNDRLDLSPGFEGSVRSYIPMSNWNSQFVVYDAESYAVYRVDFHNLEVVKVATSLVQYLHLATTELIERAVQK